jgi:hypothetical protein
MRNLKRDFWPELRGMRFLFDDASSSLSSVFSCSKMIIELVSCKIFGLWQCACRLTVYIRRIRSCLSLYLNRSLLWLLYTVLGRMKFCGLCMAVMRPIMDFPILTTPYITP